jgi:hypothetical protein
LALVGGAALCFRHFFTFVACPNPYATNLGNPYIAYTRAAAPVGVCALTNVSSTTNDNGPLEAYRRLNPELGR